MNNVSEKFYKATNNMTSNPNIKKFLNLNITAGTAIDIGCGSGRDTVTLIKNGWNVIAIDKNDASKFIYDKLTPYENTKLEFIKSDIEEVELRKSQLVVANNSLPFCTKENFKKVWNNIINSIVKDGYFLGTFFGKKDSWAKSASKMNFVTKNVILKLFDKFKIIELEEIEKDSKSVIGEYKHWHIYVVMAKKI